MLVVFASVLLALLYVGFSSSYLQACMGMLRLVRAFTGREKILKFDGCYHGHADGFLVQAGSGVATLGLPDSPGNPRRRFCLGVPASSCCCFLFFFVNCCCFSH